MLTYKPCGKDFFNRSALDVAYDLIGAKLSIHNKESLIIETEAYTQEDKASHSYNGRTIRNQAMFQEAGTIYVYLSYGLHFCFNIACKPEGVGEAVLIRAIVYKDQVINGPGRLTKFLGINKDLNCQSIVDHPHKGVSIPCVLDYQKDIKTTERIGISKAKDLLYRFVIDPKKVKEW